MKNLKIVVIIVLSLFISNTLFAQYRNPDFIAYINKYSSIAQENQRKYKIPASITLAQGLLESQAGKGRLAKEGNNHFGIKCHGWTGRKIYHDDDARGECFRRYSNASESFKDHSLFLTGRDRYSSLFDLKTTDYKGWARGLSKCGYATDKAYASKLIKLIEDYDLHKYDRSIARVSFGKEKNETVLNIKHQVYKAHGLYYIIALDGDTYESISKEFDVSVRKLRSYNEVPKNYPLRKGDVVYFDSKNKRVDRNAKRYHTVSDGESMHDISQLHGLKIKYLYKMNNKSEDYIPMEGDVLNLR